MTTIAWDGRYVAADGWVSAGGIIIGNVEKLRVRNGVVYALTGAGVLFEPMIAWWEAGHKPEDKPVCGDDDASTRLLVFTDGKCFGIQPKTPYPEELTAPDAWGAGCEIAIGAMDAGASAERALELAIKRRLHTGGPVQILDLEGCEVNGHDFSEAMISPYGGHEGVCKRCNLRVRTAA